MSAIGPLRQILRWNLMSAFRGISDLCQAATRRDR
jgi:hypothetical protein